MKNRKTKFGFSIDTMGFRFRIYKIWQIFGRFAGTFRRNILSRTNSEIGRSVVAEKVQMLQKFRVQCTYCVYSTANSFFLSCCRIQIRRGKDILSRILVFLGGAQKKSLMEQYTNGILTSKTKSAISCYGNFLSIEKRKKKYSLESKCRVI